MNIYLLDTHIFLWWLDDSKKLNKKIRSIIEDKENQIYVSAVTIWEISIKKSLKKISVPNNLMEILDSSGFDLLSMTAEHALYVEHLQKIHKDPFDRLLIAQSIVEDLELLTEDKTVSRYITKNIS